MSGSCKGLHCPGCGDGGGWVALVLIVAGAAIAVKVGKAVSRAVGEAFHVLAVVLEVVLISIASAAGLGVLAGLTWAGIRIHRRYAVRVAAADHRSLGQPVRVTAEVVRAEPQAIEAPKPKPAGLPGIREEVTW